MMRTLALTLPSLAALSAGLAAEAWTEVAPLPRGLAGHAAGASSGDLWIAGGSYWEGDAKRIATTVYRRRSDAATWHASAEISGGFAHGGAAADARALWLAGGLGASGPLDVIRSVDFATGAVHDFARLPEPRANCGAALLDGALWIVGGTPVDGDFTRTSSAVWRVDLASGDVRAGASAGPAWINPVVLAFGGALHILPGSEWSAEQKRLVAPREVWVLSASSAEWKRHPLPFALPRGLNGVALDGRHALLAGGVELREGATRISTGAWLYDSVDGKFTPAPPLPAPRLAAAMIRDVQRVLLLGGEDRVRGRSAVVWQLPLSAQTSKALRGQETRTIP
ncbi:MAG: hypothetical protein Q7S40_22005 [Opitutaceae bacterium]|nr:hypothetical protein [Opitutaceae bacterium]